MISFEGDVYFVGSLRRVRHLFEGAIYSRVALHQVIIVVCSQEYGLGGNNSLIYKQVRPLAACASLRALRPAISRPQHAQCFNV